VVENGIGFLEKADAFLAKGVDSIVVLSVNDCFVMHSWAKALGADNKVPPLPPYDVAPLVEGRPGVSATFLLSEGSCSRPLVLFLFALCCVRSSSWLTVVPPSPRPRASSSTPVRGHRHNTPNRQPVLP
jgi:hypothetical protein